MQTDGKILVGGNFFAYSGVSQNGLIRLNPNGTKDTTFDIGIGFEGASMAIHSIAIQSNGKILVGGSFQTYNGLSQEGLIRLNSDGTKDSTFNIGSGFTGVVYAITIQNNGRILAGGLFTAFNSLTQNNIIRLISTGAKDTTFNIGTGFDSTVFAIEFLPNYNNTIVVGDDFNNFNGISQNKLIRLNSNGTKDSSFNLGSGFVGGYVKTIVNYNQSNNFLIAGSFTGFKSIAINGLIRINNNGIQDTSLNIGIGLPFQASISDVKTQSDNKILVGGYFQNFNGITQKRFIRLNFDGSKDTSFDIGTGLNTGGINSIAVQPDGKIIIAGSFFMYNGILTKNIIRLKGTSTLLTNDFTKQAISLYPNPVIDILNLKLPENINIENYEIYDLLGKKVLFEKTAQSVINVSELNKGIYVIKVFAIEGIFTNKFIKQ